MGMPKRVIDDSTRLWLDRLCKRWDISGLSLGLVQTINGGRKEETYVYGVRDTLEQPMETSTRLCLGSNSKHFTAIAIGLLIHEKAPLHSGGTLNWDTKLKDIFQDDWKPMDDYTESHADVLDLLTMRTGLPSHDSAVLRDPPPEHYLHILPFLKPSSELRQNWQYNNMNYFIAANLVERVTGQPFTRFMVDKLFKSLGMTQSSYDAEEVLSTGQRAEGFNREGIDSKTASKAWKAANDDAENMTLRSPTTTRGPVECVAPQECLGTVKGCVPYIKGSNLHDAGAGGVWTTATDLCKWLGELVDPKLIPEAVLKVLRTPHAVQGSKASPEGLLGAYGCGVDVTTFRARPTFMHFGSVPGYRSITMVVSDSKGSLGVGIVSNEDVLGGEVAETIAYELMDRWLETPQSGCWERKTFDGEFRDSDNESDEGSDDEASDTQYGGDSNEATALSLVGLEGAYTSPGYPSFRLRRLAANDLAGPEFEKIRLKAESEGKVDWNHAYTGTYTAEYISDILFVATSKSKFVWVTWDWTEEMTRGQPTGYKWPVVYSSGTAVFSQVENGINGVGMFGDWWEQGDAIEDRIPIAGDIKGSAEVWFDRKAE